MKQVETKPEERPARSDAPPPRSGSGSEPAPAEGEGDDTPAFGMDNVGKHTLIYGMGIFLNKSLAFIMLPLYTRVLTPADYGVMGLIAITLDVIAIVAGRKLLIGMYRFYHKTDDPREKESVVSTTLFCLAGSYLIVSAGAFLSAGLLSELVFGSTDNAGLIRISASALAFQSLLMAPLAYARVQVRSVFFVVVNGVKFFMGAALNVVFLVFMDMGVAGVFLSSLVTNATVGTFLTVWVLREVGARYSASALKDLLRYGIPLIGVQFATFVSTFGDRYFLQMNGGEAVVGVYELAYKFGFLLTVVGYYPFEQVWGPKRFEICERDDRDRLLSDGFIYLNSLLLTAAVGIVLFVDPMLRITSDAGFHGAATLVPLLVAAYVLQCWARIQDIGILVRERTMFVTLAEWIAALIAVAAFMILIPRYLAWGAVLATFLTFVVRYVLIFTFSQRMYPVRYEWGPVVRMIGLGAGVVGVALALPRVGLIATLGIRTALAVVYLVLLWNVGGLPEQAKRGARELAARGVRRLRGRRKDSAVTVVPGDEPVS